MEKSDECVWEGVEKEDDRDLLLFFLCVDLLVSFCLERDAGILKLLFEHFDSSLSFFQFLGQLSRGLHGVEGRRATATLRSVDRVQAHGHGLLIGTTPPLIGGVRRLTGEGIGEDIVLESIGLSGHSEGERFDGVGCQLQGSGCFASHDIQASLGQPADTLGGGGGSELGKSEAPGFFIDEFEVSDVTVTLTGEVEDVGVGIEVRNDHTGGLVDIQGLGESTSVSRIPDLDLSHGLLGETNGHDGSSGAGEGDLGRLGTFVCVFDRLSNRRRSRVDQSDGLVLAGSGDQTTVMVPDDVLNELLVNTVHGVHLNTLLDIPNLGSEVGRRGSEHVGSSGMESKKSYLSAMSSKIDQRVGDGFGQTFIRDTPHLDGAVIGTGSDDVVMERIPIKVEHSAGVAGDHGCAGSVSGRVVHIHDGEGTTTTLQGNGEVLGVGLDVLLFASGGGQTEARPAVIVLGGIGVDVSVLGLSDKVRHDV